MNPPPTTSGSWFGTLLAERRNNLAYLPSCYFFGLSVAQLGCNVFAFFFADSLFARLQQDNRLSNYDRYTLLVFLKNVQMPLQQVERLFRNIYNRNGTLSDPATRTLYFYFSPRFTLRFDLRFAHSQKTRPHNGQPCELATLGESTAIPSEANSGVRISTGTAFCHD